MTMTGRRPKIDSGWRWKVLVAKRMRAPKSQAVAFSPGSAEGGKAWRISVPSALQIAT